MLGKTLELLFLACVFFETNDFSLRFAFSYRFKCKAFTNAMKQRRKEKKFRNREEKEIQNKMRTV